MVGVPEQVPAILGKHDLLTAAHFTDDETEVQIKEAIPQHTTSWVPNQDWYIDIWTPSLNGRAQFFVAGCII